MDQTGAPRAAPAAKPRAAPLARPWARVLLAAIVVALIVLIAVVPPRVRDYELFLSGFWTGEPSFLKEAGLSEMYLYVAPRERSGGRQGYLVMVDADGAMVSNQGIELEWSGVVGRWKSALKSHLSASADEVYRVKSAEFTYDDRAVMPEEMHLGLNVTQGSISLYTDEKLYAFLLKDNEVSATANEEYRADGTLPEEDP